MSANNPFQLVYDTLWTMLEEDSRFTVKEGNKIRFNGNNRQPLKNPHTSSDYPEVMLVPESGSGNLCNTSSTSMITKNYSWVISAGDLRYDKISDLEWAIFAGMLAWKDRLGPLLWCDQRFITQCNLVDTNLDQISKARSQGIEGWISVWTIKVEMFFANVSIRGTHLD